MSTIPQVATAMQRVLGPVADQVARRVKFVQRESKLGGATFVQTLVFGWLSEAAATLEELSQTAATRGVEITPQGLDERFTEAAADCVREVLDAAVSEVITADPAVISLLQRFQGVYIQDSTVITLPDELAAEWPGCGGSGEAGQAAVKLQVRWELSTGALAGPYLSAGRASDRSSALHTAPLPVGALLLRDLGYWDLADLQARDQAGSFWLSRVMPGTIVFAAAGQRWEVGEFLRQQRGTSVDVPIQLGGDARVPARLLAVRVPADIANQRRRAIRQAARRKGRTPSQATLALADWFVLATNVPATLLTLAEALVLARARWQIELLFKLWKSEGLVDEWRSRNPWRILCEVYAKLLGLLVQHWVLLVSCWQYPNRSLVKAVHTVHRHALHLASVFDQHHRLCAALTVVQRCLAVGCRINKRKAHPNTYQLLLEPALLQWEL